jgi:hypothetical protein
MKSFVLTLVAMMFVPVMLWADDEKLADEKPVAEKKAEAKAEADPEAKAKQAAETIDALEKVFEVFGAALGGRAMIAEDFAVEAAVAVDVFAPAEGGDAAAGDPLEQQFLQQFRQLSKTELNFVRVVCRPDKEQDKKLKAASAAALKTAVKKFAEIQKKLQQGIRAGEQPEWPDPRKLMSDVLLKSIKETMSEEAAKRYEAELEKRAAARKRAALLNLVAKLDKDLVLTADQRGKLTEAIEKNWKDSWCQQLETFMYGDAYMPVVPDAQILPVLSEKQKQIWNGIPKQHHQIWGWAGFGFVQGVDVGEDVGIAVEQAAEDKAEEPKKADEKKDESP